MTASARFFHLILATTLAAPLAGCVSEPGSTEMAAIEKGALMQRTLKSYHVIQSAHTGPVGYLKVFDVTEGTGPSFTWKYIYDKDFQELGWVDQFGRAHRWLHYPAGAMPNPRESFRVQELPADSIERNAMRMLGIDPALDEVTFPVAGPGDIK